jgi:UDP-N-acetylmuramoyl-tripeptide--D-alanyl-D-alanine ligase
MITVTTGWISRALSAVLSGADIDISNISTDTRNIRQGDLFVALKGHNFDGHQFVSAAIEKGAVAVIVDHPLDVTIAQILVEDTTRALGALSRAIKAQMSHQTIAITGSVGKTTVKEMVASVLSRRGNVLATKGNFNNEIGVPLTLLRLTPEHDYAVIELGANHPGEIAYSTGLVQPNVTLINNVAAAHLEGFIDLYGVARAKGEVFTNSGDDAIAVVNVDSDYSDYWLSRLKNRLVTRFSMNVNKDATVWVENISLDEYGYATFTLCHLGGSMAISHSLTNGLTSGDQTTDVKVKTVQANSVEVHLAVPGRHNVNNALAAASVCLSCGVELADISLGLSQMQPVSGRGNLLKVTDNLVIIDDTYNANVESAKAAIDLLSENNGLTVLVFGDMAELGQAARIYHEEVGHYAAQQKIDKLYTLGVLSQNASEAFFKGKKQGLGEHFLNRLKLLEQLINQLESVAGNQQKVTILVKGSRSSQMELVVQALVAHYQNSNETGSDPAGLLESKSC